MLSQAEPIQADCLIINGHVLTMDAAFGEFSSGAVAISEGRVHAVGDETEIQRRYAAARIIDAGGGFILPGLVNTHCHAAMTLFRGVAEDVALSDFLAAVWAAETRFVDETTVFIGSLIGCAEMVCGGITTFADMYWHPEATVEAAGWIGLNIVTGPVFVGFEGADKLGRWDDRIGIAERFVSKMRDRPGVHLTLAPHGCYTLDEDKLRDVATLCGKLALPMQTHAAEAESEMRQVNDVYDRTPIEVLDDTGLLACGGTIAHGVHLTDSDLTLLAGHKVGVAHCPVSNAKTAAGVAPIRALLDRGIPVGIGTDGASTGNDLDLWKTMRFCILQQRLKNADPSRPCAREVLRMATIGGAEALGLAQQTGSLEVGKRADVVVVSREGYHMMPSYDPYTTLVYAAGREDVRHVIARGRSILIDGRLSQPPSSGHLDQFGTIAAKIASLRSALNDIP